MGNQHAARPFTEKDAEVLMKLSGKSEKEIREWYESFNDESNQTGRMNKRQFQLYYTKLKKNPRLQEITDHIFRAFDTDHSGTVDFAEFLVVYIATSTGTKRQKFEYAFEVFDINENGTIEKKEAQKILNIMCRIIGLPEEDAKSYTETIMISFDINGDKSLTRNEFIDGCLHDPTLAKFSDPFDF